MLSLFMALTLSTIFRLRRTRAMVPQRYRIPLYPFMPAALVLAAFALVIYSLVQRPAESWYGAATVICGVPVYYIWRRRNNLLQHHS